MNPEERERMVDRLLNEALAPRDVEPRAGLEQRILANLRAQPERHPWWRWMWVPAAVAVAVLLVVALRPDGQKKPAKTPIATRNQQAPAVVEAPKPIVAQQKKPPKSRAHSRAIATSTAHREAPRRAVFPSPLPLTAEEQMLMTLAQRNRPEALLVARNQESERERMFKYFETGEAPAPQPIPAPNAR